MNNGVYEPLPEGSIVSFFSELENNQEEAAGLILMSLGLGDKTGLIFAIAKNLIEQTTKEEGSIPQEKSNL